MAKTIDVLANHTLDTSSLENLAHDLANRMQATIRYGYQNDFYFENEKNGIYSDFRFICLGEATCATPIRELRLTEQDYAYRNFRKLNPDASLDDAWLLENTYHRNHIAEAEAGKQIWFELKDFEGDPLLDIYKHSLQIWELDDFALNWFGRLFIYCMRPDSFANLQEWRQQHKEYLKQFGGTEIIINSFETPSAIIGDAAIDKATWPDLKQLALDRFGDKFLHIPGYLLSGINAKLPEYQIPEPLTPAEIQMISKGEKLNRPQEEFYEAYWDDF